MIDALTHVHSIREEYRHAIVTVMSSLGQTPPQTEQEWLLFDLNQKLTVAGLGKRTP